MSKPIRFASAASLVALASVIAGCAAPKPRVAGFGGKAKGEIGPATRALAALNANDFATGRQPRRARRRRHARRRRLPRLCSATPISPPAVSLRPKPPIADSLAIHPNQPQVVLKLALVEIAPGQARRGDGLARCRPRTMLDPADYGLALALAGRARRRRCACSNRRPRAQCRCAGCARISRLLMPLPAIGTRRAIVAAQDVPADQLDARIQQWMQFAKPASFRPGCGADRSHSGRADPGQPVRLALRQPETQMAEAAPAPAPQLVRTCRARLRHPGCTVPVPSPQFADNLCSSAAIRGSAGSAAACVSAGSRTR